MFTGCIGYQPKFTEPIGNITVPVGREAMFTCYVHSLGGYRVSKLIFTICICIRCIVYRNNTCLIT